jgi:cysteine-rich repeat protein
MCFRSIFWSKLRFLQAALCAILNRNLMNKHTPNSALLIGVVASVAFGLSLALSARMQLSAAVSEGCIGQPYGTPGCPVKASSSSSRSPTCGNGVKDNGEECDLGSTKNGFSNCTKDCALLYCGDGLISPAIKEECEPESEEVYALDPATGEMIVETRYMAPSCGAICTVPTCDQNGVCTGGCKRMFLPACTNSSASAAAATQVSSGSSSKSSVALGANGTLCGNGTIDNGEQCDDANATDNDACTNACRIAVCGDAVVAIWEQCDDGNRVEGDSCSNSCKSPACGDGVVQTGEECDDGNQQGNDACTNACKVPRCGDQIIQTALGEQCDDGNLLSGDSCTNTCKLPSCGDSAVQTGEECDDGNRLDTDSCNNQCVMARCGDNTLQIAAGEECDDGNRVNTDGCNNLCKLPLCGNAVREGTEECDDGNQTNNDGCSIECKKPRCGDGFVQPGEYCDDGNDNNDDSCTTLCRVPSCGDGLLSSREECDTGRSNSDSRANACRSDCRMPRCGDRVVDEGEVCDGGELCASDCSALKSAAPDAMGSTFPFLPVGIGIGGFGLLAVLAFAFRKRLHPIIAKVAGEDVANSIDDIPLDQIEMPWHNW